MKFVQAFVFLSCVASGQEFTLSTPKGDLRLNITTNSFYLSSFFSMSGIITNTTSWDLRYATLRVAFFDKNGVEMHQLCPTEISSAYCETRGIAVAAGQTVTIDTEPGVVFRSTSYLGRPREISSFKVFFKDALYDVRYKYSMLKPQVARDLSFEDSALAFRFAPAPNGIACVIQNKSDEPVTVNWNVASYVDSGGEAHKVVRSGIRLMDKEAAQPPTVIPPMAKITESLVPTDHITLSSSGWSHRPLWPDVQYLSKDASHLKQLEGSKFSVFLPVEMQGKVRNYNFAFTIDSVEF
jgi:hypothetical protein